MSSGAHREESSCDLSTWTLGQLQMFVHDARGVQQLEMARVAAQGSPSARSPYRVVSGEVGAAVDTLKR